jgi:outer membrane protein assembly factor BamE (lipoprotein component of BamABCDE complex)
MMARQGGRRRLRAAACVIVTGLACAVLPGCAATIQTVKNQAFKQPGSLQSDLKRGVSTRADVLRLLGQPDGRGGGAFASEAGQADVWYYESTDISLMSMGGNQRILVVFFGNDVFVGYMWFKTDLSIHL